MLAGGFGGVPALLEGEARGGVHGGGRLLPWCLLWLVRG